MSAEMQVTIDGAFIRSTGQYSPTIPVSGTLTTTPSGTQTIVSQTAVTLYTESPTTRTTSGNTANQNYTSAVDGTFIGVNVTAASGTSPTLTVSLQQQDANGIFQNVGSSSQLTGVGTASFSVGEGMTNGQMIVANGVFRLAWTIGGTTPSFTFQIGVTGR